MSRGRRGSGCLGWRGRLRGSGDRRVSWSRRLDRHDLCYYDCGRVFVGVETGAFRAALAGAVGAGRGVSVGAGAGASAESSPQAATASTMIAAAEVEVMADEFPQAQVLCKGGRQEQAALATRRWSSKTTRIRSGLFCGSIYWVLLVSGRFSGSIPFSQIQRSTLWLLQGLSPKSSFGGFGLRSVVSRRGWGRSGRWAGAGVGASRRSRSGWLAACGGSP